MNKISIYTIYKIDKMTIMILMIMISLSVLASMSQKDTWRYRFYNPKDFEVDRDDRYTWYGWIRLRNNIFKE